MEEHVEQVKVEVSNVPEENSYIHRELDPNFRGGSLLRELLGEVVYSLMNLFDVVENGTGRDMRHELVAM